VSQPAQGKVWWGEAPDKKGRPYLVVTRNQAIPVLRTVILASESGPGPYNARGIGENPIGPVAPAIANAVEDAVGVRIRDLPITAEKVYRALADR
jgi:CO/xanthine dehydrogenase Mo-binding subunit